MNEFMVKIGIRTDENISALILINGDAIRMVRSEWKGLTQTMKRVFEIELGEAKGDLAKDMTKQITKGNNAARKELSKVSEKIVSTMSTLAFQ